MLEKLSVSQRKILNWLAFLVIVGIGFMLIQPPKREPIQEYSTAQLTRPSEVNHNSYTDKLEKRLEEVLSQISGVGAVEVMLTLERSEKIIIAESITSEMREGETRVTRTPVTVRADGGEQEIPIILEEYEPQLRGALIIAEGASDPSIRWDIMQAAQTVLQLPMYKIEVLTKSNAKGGR